jgi:DNA-binding response OmpR family regulator
MHVLVVDDEASLLQLLGQHLVRQGHTVDTGASVAAALALIARPGTVYDCALIDWTLPDGNGLDVAREILAVDGSVRVVFTSGYPIDAASLPVEVRSRVRILQKPFLPRALSELLNNWTAA